MMLCIILDKIDMLCGAVAGIVDPGLRRSNSRFRPGVTGRGYSSNRGQIGFGNVAGENGRLRCEQKKIAGDCLFFRS